MEINTEAYLLEYGSVMLVLHSECEESGAVLFTAIAPLVHLVVTERDLSSSTVLPVNSNRVVSRNIVTSRVFEAPIEAV